MKRADDKDRLAKIARFGMTALVAGLLLTIVGSDCAFAQSGGDYILDWSTIDGGGGQSSGGTYVLTGTIGQPDADWASGGDYELLGGFWPGGPICIVDFDDLGRFCEYWLETGDGIAADLDDSNNVDFVDYSIFSDYWRYYCPADWPLK